MKARAFVSTITASILVAACATSAPPMASAPAQGAPASPSPAPAPATSDPRVAATLPIRNAGFEEPPRPGARCAQGWDCVMHNDPNSYRYFHEDGGTQGAHAFCFEAVGKEPWGSLAQAVHSPLIRGAHIRLSASLRIEGIVGQGVGPYMNAQGGSGQVLKNVQSLAPGDHGWQRVEVEMDVPEGTFVLEAGVLLLGKGKACVDDVRLEVLRPAGAV